MKLAILFGIVLILPVSNVYGMTLYKMGIGPECDDVSRAKIKLAGQGKQLNAATEGGTKEQVIQYASEGGFDYGESIIHLKDYLNRCDPLSNPDSIANLGENAQIVVDEVLRVIAMPDFGLATGEMTSVYECPNDIEKALSDHTVLHNHIQSNVDLVREKSGEIAAQDYYEALLKSDPAGIAYAKSIECLQSLGYDISQLPAIVVPEFGEIAMLVLASGIIVIVALARKFHIEK